MEDAARKQTLLTGWRWNCPTISWVACLPSMPTPTASRLLAQAGRPARHRCTAGRHRLQHDLTLVTRNTRDLRAWGCGLVNP